MHRYYKIITELFQQSNILDKIKIFENYFTKDDNVRIFLFDEVKSNVDDSFQNIKFNQYQLLGLSDYTKTWVLDSKFIGLETREILFGKLAHLDLNILGFLEQLSEGRLKNHPDDFIALLNHMKKYQFDYSDFISLIERSSSTIEDANKLANMLFNYAKFSNSGTTIYNFHQYELSNEEYCWVKEQYDIIRNGIEHSFIHYDVIKCLLLKAFLIKQDKKITNKFEKWLEYSLDTLGIYVEFESFLMFRYFEVNNKDRIFKKIMTYSKKTVSQISSTVWDIGHVRLMERAFLEDNKLSSTIYFSYFVSNDQAFTEILSYNPVRMFAIFDENYIVLREKNLYDFCDDPKLLNKVSNEKRKLKSPNFINKEIQTMISEIENRQSEIFDIF
ncbi:hypothetical protein [Streptococcus ovuberis]|uniref:Uncharacterized protein n=1 Tax=Streptococcus ovuberis TaxID=1936207 RepID=A0A7X6S1F1_9STRE|nr:hypothetical protein [Streptococcus ovuberis]NKZ21183.1 hypothetical protein [Streptococcus ovuberis]